MKLSSLKELPFITKTNAWVKNEILASKSVKRQLLVALACIIGTASISLPFVKESMVAGWQLWSWAIFVIVIVIALTPRISLKWNRAWLIYPILFFSALLIRLPFLQYIPGGLHTDEEAVANFAMRQIYLQDGTVNPFYPGYSAQPTLYHYIVRLTLDLFGRNIAALRVSSALIGSLAIIATFLMIETIANRKTALFACVLMTAYHFHVHWSRIAFNNIWDTLWVPLMVFGFVWGWKKGWEGGAVISGLALGLSQYFYSGAKIGIFLLLFLAITLWKKQSPLKSRLIFLGKLILTAVCAAAPMILFAIWNWQQYNERNYVVWAWKPAYIQLFTGLPINIPAFFWHQLTRSFGAYFIYPDVVGFYLPGIPLLIGLAVPLFILGIVISISKREWLPVLWILLVTFFGGFLLVDNPSSNHFVASIPAICWLVSIPLVWISESKYRILAVVLLSINVLTDLYFYFGVYFLGSPRDFIYPFPPFP